MTPLAASIIAEAVLMALRRDRDCRIHRHLPPVSMKEPTNDNTRAVGLR
ncbi:hypothetical protein [Nocardia sp. NPDC056100]